MPGLSSRPAACLLLGAILLPGCAHLGRSADAGPIYDRGTITSAQIASSNTTNVWDLLRERARRYSYKEDAYGRPVSIASNRGRASFALRSDDIPIIIIDGARLSDVSALQLMMNDEVDSIDLLNGMNGTATQGTGAGAGVIYVHTRFAPDREQP